VEHKRGLWRICTTRRAVRPSGYKANITKKKLKMRDSVVSNHENSYRKQETDVRTQVKSHEAKHGTQKTEPSSSIYVVQSQPGSQELLTFLHASTTNTRRTLLHEKLIVAQQFKQFPAFHGILKFVTVFPRAYHRSLS
jgi:hypothetical protein